MSLEFLLKECIDEVLIQPNCYYFVGHIRYLVHFIDEESQNILFKYQLSYRQNVWIHYSLKNRCFTEVSFYKQKVYILLKKLNDSWKIKSRQSKLSRSIISLTIK